MIDSAGEAPPDVPRLRTEQMVEVDRAMVQDLGIELIQMMENAGRNLAELARRRFLDGDPLARRLLVLAGTGGNGGGAMVAARRLAGWGARVSVCLSRDRDVYAGVPARQLEILRRMEVPLVPAAGAAEVEPIDLLIDGLIGYGLSGPPTGMVAELIRQANRRSAPILALDAPSGLDTTTGRAYEPTIRATATMTLALPKSGLLAPGAAGPTGELYLADIGVPPSLYARPGLDLHVGPLFARNEILRVRT